MRAKDAARLSAVRLLLAAMKQKEVDERVELDDADVLAMIEKMIKQRRESIAQFEKAARNDLAEAEKSEIGVLSGLPAAADVRSRGRAGDRRGDRRDRRERRQGHGQGHGAAEAAPRRPRRHGQGLGAGQSQAFRVKSVEGADPSAVIPDSFKQDLLNRVDIVDVVSRYVRLKKGGANFQGLCPFHNEKSPSFTVSPAKQFYHCFGCGAHGNAIGFLMAYGGLGYVDAMKDLASMVGMQVPEAQPRTREEAERETERKERETGLVAVMEKAMEFYRAELKKAPRAIEYLKGRGLTGEIAARFRIGYAPDGWQGLKDAFPGLRATSRWSSAAW